MGPGLLGPLHGVWAWGLSTGQRRGGEGALRPLEPPSLAQSTDYYKPPNPFLLPLS